VGGEEERVEVVSYGRSLDDRRSAEARCGGQQAFDLVAREVHASRHVAVPLRHPDEVLAERERREVGVAARGERRHARAGSVLAGADVRRDEHRRRAHVGERLGESERNLGLAFLPGVRRDDHDLPLTSDARELDGRPESVERLRVTLRVDVGHPHAGHDVGGPSDARIEPREQQGAERAERETRQEAADARKLRG
jgi:hypothetical protein